MIHRLKSGAAVAIAIAVLFASGPSGPDARADGVCPDAPLGTEFSAQVPKTGRHDPWLVDAAVLHYTNVERCKAGLVPLSAVETLRKAARTQTRDMARLGFFDHTSTETGRTSPSDRVKEVDPGNSYRVIAENLVESFFVAYQNNTPYRVVDADACKFLDDKGREMPRQTYDSMAKEFVDRWMNSPGHRRNILEPSFRFHGAGMAPTDRGDLCGALFGAQVFAG